jgi:hypothetical protein
VEVRLKLLKLSISKTAELERVGTHRNRVSSIKATSQSSSKNHASGRHTSDLEATRASRSKAKGSAIERLAAHVVVVLRDGVERVDIAALVDATAVDEAAEDAADERGAGAEDTVAGEAFAVETLLGFDGGGEDHGEGDEGVN